MNASFLIALAKCVIIPVITVMTLNYCNLLENFNFIPKDKMFDIGLMIYLAIFECIWAFISKLFTESKTNIKCVFSTAGQASSIDTISLVQFTDDVSIIDVKLSINGPTKKIKKKTITIPFPSWVDVQASHRALTLIDKRTFKVNLGKIVNINNKTCTDTTCRFKISVARNFSDDEGFMDEVVPTIDKKFKTTFSTNILRLK